MANTGSSHAGADLRVEDVRISSQFIEKMSSLDAPLPWNSTDLGEVIDANDYTVCRCDGPSGGEIAAMIVVAINTCGSFRVTRRDNVK